MHSIAVIGNKDFINRTWHTNISGDSSRTPEVSGDSGRTQMFLNVGVLLFLITFVVAIFLMQTDNGIHRTFVCVVFFFTFKKKYDVQFYWSDRVFNRWSI